MELHTWNLYGYLIENEKLQHRARYKFVTIIEVSVIMAALKQYSELGISQTDKWEVTASRE